MPSITSKLNVRLLSSLAISSLLLFSACGGGSSGSSGIEGIEGIDDGAHNSAQNDESVEAGSIEGKFMDSSLEGIIYYTDTTSGYTDDNGKFFYNKKDTYISFLVGSIIIIDKFDLSKLNADGIIFPSDILGIERGNTTNKDLVNILRLLYSIDEDNDASNGIYISDNINNSLTANEEVNIENIKTSDLKKMVEDAGKTFIHQSKARRHYIKL